MNTTSEFHAVFATSLNHKRYRVSEPLGWSHAVARWNELDNLRTDGRFPHVKFFEVRSMNDPGYEGARTSKPHSFPTDKKYRGYTSPETAAKIAWKIDQGEIVATGQSQGVGGWYFWASGKAAFQGAGHYPHLGAYSTVTNYAIHRGLIVQDAAGKWHPHVEVA